MYIKNEPGTSYDNLQSLPPSASIPANYGNQVALQRAGQALQEKFGPAASSQISQLNAQARAATSNQNAAQQRPQGQPPHMQQLSEEQRRRMYMQQSQQAQHAQQYQNLQAQQRAAAINNNQQTDGASDWDSMVARRREAAIESGSTVFEADMTIRERIEQMSHEMEGGGLMLPLSEHSRTLAPKKRKTTTQPVTTLVSQVPRAAQFDGADDSDDDDKVGVKDDPEVEDEDAINSDLDDPDDDVVEETEEDANQGEVMLCTYDKVQRVKNKWKCTLKDGVLTTGGKEYVFNKAHGEFEW